MAGLLRSNLATALLLVFCLSMPRTALHAAELVMFESDFCEWCTAWHEEIGPIYPKTAEGKRAPLRSVDINDQRPHDLQKIKGVRFTPTFVLLDDNGREVGRINGYPGEDFFWGLLGELIASGATTNAPRANKTHTRDIPARSTPKPQTQ